MFLKYLSPFFCLFQNIFIEVNCRNYARAYRIGEATDIATPEEPERICLSFETLYKAFCSIGKNGLKMLLGNFIFFILKKLKNRLDYWIHSIFFYGNQSSFPWSPTWRTTVKIHRRYNRNLTIYNDKFCMNLSIIHYFYSLFPQFSMVCARAYPKVKRALQFYIGYHRARHILNYWM